MRRLVLICILALTINSAWGQVSETKIVRLELTLQEAQAAVDLWDAGVKAVGIQSAEMAATLLRKMQAAVTETQKKP